VRQRPAQGDVQASSEVEFRQCGAVPLERIGVSPEGGWGQLFWWAAGASRTVGPCLRSVIVLDVSFVGEFVYVSLFAKESGFSLEI
jgi:hypothetical protein